MRLDKFLALNHLHLSRVKCKEMVLAGLATVNEKVVREPTSKVGEGDVVALLPASAEVLCSTATAPGALEADHSIPLDIVYEDEHVAIVNKQAGLVVHSGVRNESATLVHALLARYPQIRGVGGAMRPGIVHRLDKDTSGLMVVALSDIAYLRLIEMIAAREMRRSYLCVTHGIPSPLFGTIELNMGKDRANPTKMRIYRNGGKVSITHYRVTRRHNAGKMALVECTLKTGRTHQIRLHMAHIKCPIIGDHKYGSATALGRQALHAFSLSLEHPITAEILSFESALPADIEALLLRFAS
jgi:23S rRNA pseudouridine1911/1915/1917 synthase